MPLWKTAICIIYSWYVLLGLPSNRYWFQSISLVWWDGRSFKTSRIGSKPWGPEHVYCLGLLQNLTHSRVSHLLPILVWILQSLRDKLISTILPHLQVFNQYIFFPFKFLSNWSLGVLFLTLICAFRKKVQLKQTINTLVSVLFSWQTFWGTLVVAKHYLLAAKPYNNLIKNNCFLNSTSELNEFLEAL